MDEFARGGRLSPQKTKQFIPAGTLGIGEDKNVWIRKARKDGATYWEEYIYCSDFKYFKALSYSIDGGITFAGYTDETNKTVLQFTYNYNEGFIFNILDVDAEKDISFVYTDLEQARNKAIEIRDNSGSWDRNKEMTKIFTEIFSAFDKGLLRRNFTEETEPTPESREPLEPLFEVGDFVRVTQTGYHIPYFEEKKVEYKFDKPTDYPDLEEGDEGYIVGYFEDDADGEMEIVYVVKNQSKIGTINLEFLIGGEGLELIRKTPKIGDHVIMNDMNFLYPTAPSIKEKLGFKNPENISVQNEVFMSYGKIFVKGQDPYTLMPIYGVYSPVLDQDTLIGIKGFELASSQDSHPLRNKKIRIDNAEENKLIQKFAFKLGYEWLGREKDIVLEFDNYPVYMEFDTEKTMYTLLNEKAFEREPKLETTLQELGLLPTEDAPKPESKEEFTCKVDASKIDSAYVGAFYSKNKERINKLNSEFSCKILEALVYLSDYEKCGGGVELPVREVEEEDDLLGAIRNLKN